MHDRVRLMPLVMLGVSYVGLVLYASIGEKAWLSQALLSGMCAMLGGGWCITCSEHWKGRPTDGDEHRRARHPATQTPAHGERRGHTAAPARQSPPTRRGRRGDSARRRGESA